MNWLAPTPATTRPEQDPLEHIDAQLTVLSRSLHDWLADKHRAGDPFDMRDAIDRLLDDRIALMAMTPADYRLTARFRELAT